jgi:HSP20 family molecular chaperone IbpA
MTRLAVFNHPLLLGFEQFERVLDRIGKSSADGYPPFNIEQLDDNALRITLAVAGFAVADLSVEVEDRQLTVRGQQADETGNGDRVFLHRGIAARQFQRSFVLADGMQVTGATLDNGLLHVDLVRPTATPRVQKVEIKSPGSARPAQVRTAASNGGNR